MKDFDLTNPDSMIHYAPKAEQATLGRNSFIASSELAKEHCRQSIQQPKKLEYFESEEDMAAKEAVRQSTVCQEDIPQPAMKTARVRRSSKQQQEQKPAPEENVIVTLGTNAKFPATYRRCIHGDGIAVLECIQDKSWIPEPCTYDENGNLSITPIKISAFGDSEFFYLGNTWVIDGVLNILLIEDDKQEDEND